MNLYGDQGNALVLAQRSRWRGIRFEIRNIEIGHPIDAGDLDILLIGGGQDQEQRLAADDLSGPKKSGLEAFVNDGGVALAVCGGYQLFGHYYKAGEGDILPGAGVLNAWTEHPGPRDRRCIGNIVIDTDIGPMVGFENHGGKTFLGDEAKAFGTVRRGFGNNGRDGTEGCVNLNVFGTYLHGSILPKNPAFADRLLALALERRYGSADLESLDDRLEATSQESAIKRFG